MLYCDIEKILLSLKNDNDKAVLCSFFKNKKGEYGYGDIFLGIRAGKLNYLAKLYYRDLDIAELEKLLKSKYHEIRSYALRTLVLKYKKQKELQNDIYKLYLLSAKHINNWDLVDISAPCIAGGSASEDDIWNLAKSSNMWANRIAIVSTLPEIKQGNFELIFNLTKYFINTKCDLTSKALGWMLREVGKVDILALVNFLNSYAFYLPRTTLRYAIEKFSDKDRKKFLNMKTRKVTDEF